MNWPGVISSMSDRAAVQLQTAATPQPEEEEEDSGGEIEDLMVRSGRGGHLEL